MTQPEHKNMISLEQQARDLLERAGVEKAQEMTAGDLVEIANLLSSKTIPVQSRTTDQAVFVMSMKAMGLQGQLREERERSAVWRKLANGYDDIRNWLRACPDNPEGWQEFYKEACLIVFGTYGDDFADDDSEEFIKRHS